MEWSRISDKKNSFIRDVILSNTISAAFQHASVYNEKSSQREEFQENVKKYLVETAEKYRQTNDHFERIREFKVNVENTEYRSILRNEQISFGVAQKLVNLYLKYLWCLGKFDMPPHCPIDRFVIDNGCQNPRLYHPWTQMTQEKYVDAMNEIKQTAGNESLAVWELDLWNGGTSVENSVGEKRESI